MNSTIQFACISIMSITLFGACQKCYSCKAEAFIPLDTSVTQNTGSAGNVTYDNTGVTNDFCANSAEAELRRQDMESKGWNCVKQ